MKSLCEGCNRNLPVSAGIHYDPHDQQVNIMCTDAYYESDYQFDRECYCDALVRHADCRCHKD